MRGEEIATDDPAAFDVRVPSLGMKVMTTGGGLKSAKDSKQKN
jgi:hypothetical protein